MRLHVAADIIMTDQFSNGICISNSESTSTRKFGYHVPFRGAVAARPPYIPSVGSTAKEVLMKCAPTPRTATEAEAHRS